MAVNIVTGMTGIEHITSDDDRIRNASTFGTGKYVLPVGKRFETVIVNNNLIRIKDGMCINQGTQMGLELDDYEEVVIENGLSGTNRHDLIVMRYEKQNDTAIESASLVVIKGTSGEEPSDPEYEQGNILDGGDLIDDMPLFRVRIESLSIVGVDVLFTLFKNQLDNLSERIDDLRSDLDDENFQTVMKKENPTGTGTLSINRSNQSGTNSIAIGGNSGNGLTAIASGENSVAVGTNAIAQGKNSVAIGTGTKVTHANQFALGQYNENLEDNAFEIGGGTSSERKNLFKVLKNGDIQAAGDVYDGAGNKLVDGGTILGEYVQKSNPVATGSVSVDRKANTTIGKNSVAIGVDSQATEDDTFAIGKNAAATGVDSLAIGIDAKANATDGIAIGIDATVNKANGIAIGKFATVNYEKGVAIGNGVATGNQRAITAIGRYNTGENPFEVGDGTGANNRSNLFWVDEDGYAHSKNKPPMGTSDGLISASVVNQYLNSIGSNYFKNFLDTGTPSAVVVNHNEIKSVASLQFTKGTYVIVCHAKFQGNVNVTSGGRRRILLATLTNTYSAIDTTFIATEFLPTDINNNYKDSELHLVSVFRFTSTVTRYLLAEQTSGESLNVYGRIKALRLGN